MWEGWLLDWEGGCSIGCLLNDEHIVFACGLRVVDSRLSVNRCEAPSFWHLWFKS